MYNSKYYTVEEIDERLLQGYYNDAVAAGYSKTKEEFDKELFQYNPVHIQDIVANVREVTPGDANVAGDIVYSINNNKFFTKKVEGLITRYYEVNSLQPIIGTRPIEGTIYVIGDDVYMGVATGITQLGNTVLNINELKTAFIVDNKPTSLAFRIILGVANPNITVINSIGGNNYNSGVLTVTSDSFKHCLNLNFNTMCIPNDQGEFDGSHEHATGYPRDWHCHYTFDYEGGDYHRNTWSKWRCLQEEINTGLSESGGIAVNDNGQAPDPKKNNAWADMREQEVPEEETFEVVEESTTPDIPMTRMNGSWHPILTQEIKEGEPQKKTAPSTDAVAKRFKSVDAKDAEQDKRITDVEAKNAEQDKRITDVEAKNAEQDGKLATLEDKVHNINHNINVVQDMGESTTDVMSQKAISDIFQALVEDFDYVLTDITERLERLEPH